jgi:hypothetical protein
LRWNTDWSRTVGLILAVDEKTNFIRMGLTEAGRGNEWIKVPHNKMDWKVLTSEMLIILVIIAAI